MRKSSFCIERRKSLLLFMAWRYCDCNCSVYPHLPPFFSPYTECHIETQWNPEIKLNDEHVFFRWFLFPGTSADLWLNLMNYDCLIIIAVC